MSKDKLRIGVLGAGKWAELAHLPGWARDPRSEVVVICDINKAKAQDIASEHGIEKYIA